MWPRMACSAYRWVDALSCCVQKAGLARGQPCGWEVAWLQGSVWLQDLLFMPTSAPP